MTLSELIILCKKHDAKAQGELYKRYSGTLFSICLRYSPNYVEAEDSLQDAFITIFKKIEQFKDKGSFEGWMKRITVNTVLQKYRKKRVFDIRDEGQILLGIVQELPDRYRLVFTMYVLDGYAHKEIADMLGISDGTSKSNLARARGILKIKIEEYTAQKAIE